LSFLNLASKMRFYLLVSHIAARTQVGNDAVTKTASSLWPAGSRVLGRRLRLEQLEDRCMLATITVTSLADNMTINGQVTLREAIYAAENDASFDGSTTGNGADTIQFASNLSGTATVTIVSDATYGASAFLITSNITIQGSANVNTIARNLAGVEMRLFSVESGGTLTLKELNITGGQAYGDSGGGDGLGGAIFNLGTLEIEGCALYNNQAIGGIAGSGGFRGAGRGGAIYSYEGNVFVRNSTLSGNSAVAGSGPANGSGSFGGALYSLNGELTIDNSTITLSTATSGKSVFVVAVEGTASANIYSSIIGQADLPNLGYDLLIAYDTNGELEVAGSNNLIRVQNDFSQITVSNADPLLGALQNNGGSTLTHEPATNSPVVNQGINPLNLTTDQRGGSHARVVGGVADIGAFELQSAVPPSLPGDYNENHFVDTADYIVWRKTLNTSVPQYSGADGSGNGFVDAADLTLWRQNFGNSEDQGAAAALAMSTTASQSAKRTVVPTGAVASKSLSIGRMTTSRPNHVEEVAASRDSATLNLLDCYSQRPEWLDTTHRVFARYGGNEDRVRPIADSCIDQFWANWGIYFD
jgi:hypothetical protein